MLDRHARRQRQNYEKRAAASHRAAVNGEAGITTQKHAEKMRRKRNRSRMKKAARTDAAGNGRVTPVFEESEDEEESIEDDERNASEMVTSPGDSIAMAMTMATLTALDIRRDMQSPHPPVVNSKEQWPPRDCSVHSAPTSSRPRVHLPCDPGEAASLQAEAILRAVVPSRPANPLRESVSALQSFGHQSRTAQQFQENGHKNTEVAMLPDLTGNSITNGPPQAPTEPRTAIKKRRRPRAEDFWSSDEDGQELPAKRYATADSLKLVNPAIIPQWSQASQTAGFLDHPATSTAHPSEYVDKRLEDTDNPRHLRQNETLDPRPNLLTQKREGEDHCSDSESEHIEPKRKKIRRRRRKRKVPRTSPDAYQLDTTTQLSAAVPKRQIPDRSEPQVSCPKFDSLPGNVQDMIFGMSLKSEEPLKMKTISLASKTPPEARIPSTTMTFVKGSSSMTTTRKYYLKSRHTFQSQLDRFKATLQQAPYPVRQPRAPGNRRSALPLLYVSKAVHERAAKILYGENVFQIDSRDEAWLYLEDFLATIGPRNVGYLQHLRVSAPKWYPNSSKDAVTGAILDYLKPSIASPQDPSQDRLFSAITNCTQALSRSGGLKSLEIVISCTEIRTFIDFHAENWRCILSDAEQAEHTKRKDEGARLFRAMSEALGPDCKPLLVVETGEKISWLLKGAAEKQFADRSVEMVDEAEKYGWNVEEEMREME